MRNRLKTKMAKDNRMGLQVLATLKKELGTLDNVKQIVKIVGFVACTDDFDQQPSVINGASDFFVELFLKTSFFN